MAITSADIQNQSFSIDRKGYDVDEVDVFLEHVADEIDILNQRIAEFEGGSASESDEFDDMFAGFDTEGSQLDEDLDFTLDEVQVASAEAAPAVNFDEELAAKDAQIAELQAAIAEKDAIIADRDAEINELVAEIEELHVQLDDLDSQLAEKNDAGNAIAQALIIAQRSADEILNAAYAESAKIIADAEDDADRILAQANEERELVIEKITQLETECSETRVTYQDMLKDFINDAQGKLAVLGAQAAMAQGAAASAQARAAKARTTHISPTKSQDPIRRDSNAAYPSVEPINYFDGASETVAMPAAVAAVPTTTASGMPLSGSPIAVAPAPTPSAVEKDMSGYGDADDFQFDEVD